jgi:hypothetical protein
MAAMKVEEEEEKRKKTASYFCRIGKIILCVREILTDGR